MAHYYTAVCIGRSNNWSPLFALYILSVMIVVKQSLFWRPGVKVKILYRLILQLKITLEKNKRSWVLSSIAAGRGPEF